MKIQELKNSVRTEDFETVCSLIYEAVAEHKINSVEFSEIMLDVINEFAGEELDEFDYDETDEDFLDDFDDEELDENY